MNYAVGDEQEEQSVNGTNRQSTTRPNKTTSGQMTNCHGEEAKTSRTTMLTTARTAATPASTPLLVIGLAAQLESDKRAFMPLLEQVLRARDHYDGYALDPVFVEHLLADSECAKSTSMQQRSAAADIVQQAAMVARLYQISELRSELWPFAALRHIKQRSRDAGSSKRVHVIGVLTDSVDFQLMRAFFGASFIQIGLLNDRTNEQQQQQEELISTSSSCRLLLASQSDLLLNMSCGDQANGNNSVAAAAASCADNLQRFFDLLFGNPFVTPTRHEYFMYMAYASSLRSASLSRQCGAVIVSPQDDVIAVGANEVPKFGGGQYWPPSTSVASTSNLTSTATTTAASASSVDGRQFSLYAHDTNKRQIEHILQEICDNVLALGLTTTTTPTTAAAAATATTTRSTSVDEETLRTRLRESARLLAGLTEYDRETHAEIEALMACARTAAYTTRGSLMYATTFPCHTCAKLIVSAGISRVYFVEPYPKSKIELYADSVRVVRGSSDTSYPMSHSSLSAAALPQDKVVFEQFDGIGPRRYFDLFSLRLSNHASGGEGLRRKCAATGRIVDWAATRPKQLRLPLVDYVALDFDALRHPLVAARPELAERLARFLSMQSSLNATDGVYEEGTCDLMAAVDGRNGKNNDDNNNNVLDENLVAYRFLASLKAFMANGCRLLGGEEKI